MVKRNRSNRSLHTWALCAAIVFACAPGVVRATVSNPPAEVEFDGDFLGKRNINLARFRKGNAALPGKYNVDGKVNSVSIGKIGFELRGNESGDTQVCFTPEMLDRAGVNRVALLPESTALLAASQPDTCLKLPELVPHAKVEFDNSEQLLDISIPQAMLISNARGYVDPRYWDNGVNAATLQYTSNFYRSRNQGGQQNDAYVGLTAGINMGPWRFRHQGNISSNDNGPLQYQPIQTNLQRAIPRLESQLTVGDAFTDGQIFDSYALRGALLASDERMQPESRRGFAPTVHGIASSNARVRVLQNGNVIYETTVAPGPFTISDLYPTGYGGDLQVVVTEADGSEHTQSLPYSASVNAVRQGVTQYAVSAGQYHDLTLNNLPWLAQGTVKHGVSNQLSVYAGALAGQGYQSATGGVALNTSYGAFGLDLTGARTALQNIDDRTGASMRLSYSHAVAATDTNVVLAAYRYSTQGFLNVRDAMLLRDLDQQQRSNAMGGTQRGRLEATINQNLPHGYGAFYLNGSVQNYWDQPGRNTQYAAGYNATWHGVGLGASLNRDFDYSAERWNTRAMLSLNVPLDFAGKYTSVTTSVQRDAAGTQLQQNLGGYVGAEDNPLSYNVGLAANRMQQGNSNDVSASAAYNTRFSALNASASHSGGNSQLGFGMAGGVVGYAGGVLLTPSMGETVAIVEAKDAAGARVTSASGLKVDRWGHALAANLQPYSRNTIEIDPKGIDMGTELKSTQQTVIPTLGAVTVAQFETSRTQGRNASLKTTQADGTPLPFGAEVVNAAGEVLGVVGQGGRILLTGLSSDQGDLTVRWGEAETHTCQLSYVLPAASTASSSGYAAATGVCL